MTRSLTVFNTRGVDEIEIDEFEGETLKEVQQVFEERGVRYEGMSIVLRGHSKPLVDPSTILPTGNIVVYIVQQKSELGRK
ncbi:hypothetical protein SAMN05428988_3252 [Chitinophaga sp. YR573]|uniref:hypothetical protein n=1 Tax=Chitinophaga sp. YR573 TaxID=1881040 RepID=UPI0008B90F0F|nr:hypothetical protein [Chitinophaga sp. YR573]SEW21816.1 hypothetical protein SAMN05428988_3252 [Chitinophaga sp. YR573]